MYTCANALRGSSGSIPFLAFSAKELREILLDRHCLATHTSETIAGIACKKRQISNFTIVAALHEKVIVGK